MSRDLQERCAGSGAGRGSCAWVLWLLGGVVLVGAGCVAVWFVWTMKGFADGVISDYERLRARYVRAMAADLGCPVEATSVEDVSGSVYGDGVFRATGCGRSATYRGQRSTGEPIVVRLPATKAVPRLPGSHDGESR